MSQQTRAYENYQLQWLIDHRYSLDDLMAALQAYKQDCGDEEPEDIRELFNQWEMEIGFNGEIYACYEEFLNNDYRA